VKRDAQDDWTLLTADHWGPLAVDGAGNLYVADTDNNRVLMYVPHP
jgi:NHL repeat-containing protein